MTNYFKKYLFKLTFVFVVALCTVTAISSIAHADDLGKSTEVTNMPFPRGGFSSVNLNGKIYVIAGREKTFPKTADYTYNSVYSYDPTSNTWTKKADVPESLDDIRSVVVCDGKIYTLGGVTHGKTVSSVYCYDPTADIWTKKSNTPQESAGHSVVVLDGKIYMIGIRGDDANPLPYVNVYDPVTNTWTKKANMPEANSQSSSVVYNGKIYVIGGYNGTTAISSIMIYDSTTNTWTKRENILPEPLWAHTSVVLNDKIYILGGCGTSDILTLDPNTLKVEKKSNMVLPRNIHASVVLNNKIYTLGGHNNKQSYLSSVEVYDPNPNATTATLFLNKTTLDLEVGQTDKLTATITPESTPKQKIIWSSSYPSIASISVDGDCYVTGEKEGTAVITAKTEDGKLIATCTVNVRGEGEVLPSKNRALLRVALTNGSINEYDLSMTEVQNFINWYNGRAEGKGKISFAINKNANVKPFKTRTDYLVFDKIYSFEVNEYELNNNEK